MSFGTARPQREIQNQIIFHVFSAFSVSEAETEKYLKRKNVG
jgi:hypothetical protein